MAIPLNDNIRFETPKPSEDRYLKPDGTRYANAAEVNSIIAKTRRYIDCIVATEEGLMIYSGGVEDTDLIPFVTPNTTNIEPKRFYFTSVSNTNSPAVELANKINTSAVINILGTILPFFHFTVGDSKYVYTFNKKVKGVYGQGWEQVTENDLQFISQFAVNSFTVTDSNTDRINLAVDIAPETIDEYMRGLFPSVEVKPLAEGYTVFQALVNGVSKEWLYFGQTGLIGINDYQPLAQDFKNLDKSNSAIPTFQSIIDAGGGEEVIGNYPSGTYFEDTGTSFIFSKGQNSFGFIGDIFALESPKLRILGSQPTDAGKLLMPDANGYFQLVTSTYTDYDTNDFLFDFDQESTDTLTEGTTNKYNRQGNFNQIDNTAPDYIKNKPPIIIYQRVNVTTSRNFLESDNGKTLIITGTVTLTFSGVLPEDFNFNFKVKVGGSLTIANGDKTLLDTTETAQTQIVAEASAFGTVYQFDTNTFIAEGI